MDGWWGRAGEFILIKRESSLYSSAQVRLYLLLFFLTKPQGSLSLPISAFNIMAIQIRKCLMSTFTESKCSTTYSISAMQPSSFERLRKTSHFRFSFSKKFCPSRTSALYLEDEKHIYHSRTVSRLNAHPQDVLVVRVAAFLARHRGHVVKNWCRRRTRSALMEALRERGFNQQGMRLSGKSMKGIFGVLELQPFDTVVHLDWAQLRQEMILLVKELEKRCESSSCPGEPKSGKKLWRMVGNHNANDQGETELRKQVARKSWRLLGQRA